MYSTILYQLANRRDAKYGDYYVYSIMANMLTILLVEYFLNIDFDLSVSGSSPWLDCRLVFTVINYLGYSSWSPYTLCGWHMLTMWMTCAYHVDDMCLPCRWHVLTIYMTYAYHVDDMCLPCGWQIPTMWTTDGCHVDDMCLPPVLYRSPEWLALIYIFCVQWRSTCLP